MLPSSTSAKPAPRRRFINWADALALLVIAFVAYKLLLEPRRFEAPHAIAAPIVRADALDGAPFDLVAQRGHVVFLDFWASWCVPCKISLPLVEKYARDHPASRVYAVNVGEPVGVVREFARAHQLGRVVLDPQQGLAAQFGVSAFPTMVVIDAGGFVRAKWLGINPAIGAAMANAEAGLK